ncbi:MAG: complex I NDUFA9 subunit family protein [bacterium]|nr:complex I NDUFA9 subunit family protein [bacterium]MDT8395930.1 complex I NDUFA9 subunit family protein [bacterium]
MRIAVTGGTGFVGKAVVSELLERGHQVRILARSRQEQADSDRLSYHTGSVVTGEGLNTFLNGSDAVVHLVGIIKEAGSNTFDAVHHQGTVNVLGAARQAKIQRYLHMSALGTREGAMSGYHRSKWAGEEAVRESGLAWTIFRPSIIFGPEDAFINMLADTLRITPVMPVFGGGQSRMQPVHVQDVAASFAAALERPGCIGKVYELGGPDVLSFKDILHITAQTIDKKRYFIPVPFWMVKPPVSAMQAIGIPLPVTSDQLQMLQEDNIRKGGDDITELGIVWTGFEEGIRSYLGSKRE